MIRQKREPLELVKEILRVVSLNKNVGSVKILQKANLSPDMFAKYKKELIEKGLMTLTITDKKCVIAGKNFKAGKKVYNITELGKGYLEDYRVVERFIEKYRLKD